MKIKKSNKFTISLVLLSFLVLGILDIVVQNENNIKEANSVNYLILNQEFGSNFENLISKINLNSFFVYFGELNPLTAIYIINIKSFLKTQTGG